MNLEEINNMAESSSDHIEMLEAELKMWEQNFHDYCDSQLDFFRKEGMNEAAIRCTKIAYEILAESRHITLADKVVEEIRKEFNYENTSQRERQHLQRLWSKWHSNTN